MIRSTPHFVIRSSTTSIGCGGAKPLPSLTAPPLVRSPQNPASHPYLSVLLQCGLPALQLVHETLAENTAGHDSGPVMRVKADPSVAEESKLESYRFCEETWTLELTQAEVHLPGDVPAMQLPRAMIVAVQSEQAIPLQRQAGECV